MNKKQQIIITIFLGILSCSSSYAFQDIALNAPDATGCTNGIPTTCHIDDASISTGVEAKIGQEPSLRGLVITVSTDRGVVSLDGNVRTKQQENTAINAAKMVNGVKAVQSNIEITNKPIINAY